MAHLLLKKLYAFGYSSKIKKKVNKYSTVIKKNFMIAFQTVWPKFNNFTEDYAEQ